MGETTTSRAMGLGWWVQFAPPSRMEAMSDFFGRIMGLPRILKSRTSEGQQQNKDHFWAGETIVIDSAYHASEAPVGPREAHPATARQIAIHRTGDLDALLARLRANGAQLLWTRTCFHGRESFVVTPVGTLIGFRERDDASPLVQDVEGRRRRRRGEAFNPGCAPMPFDVQEIGWIRLTVGDFPAMVRFYREVLQLAFIGQVDGAALFDLGDNTTLELVAGGAPRRAPVEQREAGQVMILRVPEFAGAFNEAQHRGAAARYKRYASAQGAFSYVADPEGNLVGLADRAQPGAYSATLPVRPEDLEAQRRWVETTRGRG